jgi:diguanylate cyclase (GGDEF)-like protein
MNRLEFEGDFMTFPPLTVTFRRACEQVLGYLQERVGLDHWHVMRVQDGQLVAIYAVNSTWAGPLPQVVCPMEDSLCERMLNHGAPRVAADLRRETAYAGAPVLEKLNWGAYVGVPLLAADGTVFGTICAGHPTTLPIEAEFDLPLIELQAELLSMILALEMEQDRQARRAEQAEASATHDALTGLYNRRAWETLLEAEEKRCLRFAHNAAVFSIDLDELKETNDTRGHAAGDDLLKRAGEALTRAVRMTDAVARLGGDEFAVLAPECNAAHARDVLHRIEAQFAGAGVRASIGVAHREIEGSLAEAMQSADEAMYRLKRAKKAFAESVAA